MPFSIPLPELSKDFDFCVTGGPIFSDEYREDANVRRFKEHLEFIAVFARVNPDQKVSKLQNNKLLNYYLFRK